jgi:hypothetical protein
MQILNLKVREMKNGTQKNPSKYLMLGWGECDLVFADVTGEGDEAVIAYRTVHIAEIDLKMFFNVDEVAGNSINLASQLPTSNWGAGLTAGSRQIVGLDEVSYAQFVQTFADSGEVQQLARAVYARVTAESAAAASA